jgi:hypothetical protein
MRRSNRADYKSATQNQKPLQIGKTTAPGAALMAGMAILVQEIQGSFGKLLIGIKPA